MKTKFQVHYFWIKILGYFQNVHFTTLIFYPYSINFTNLSILDDEIQVKQKLPADEKPEEDETVREFGYGFGWLRRGVLAKFGTELEELFDLRDADSIKIDKRLQKIQKIDEENFDSEYYL